MSDEDFMLGYAVGYNSKSSGGGGIDDITVLHTYQFGNSGYGLGVVDYNTSTGLQRWNGSMSSYSDYDNGYYTYHWSPDANMNYLLGYAMMYNGKIIGVIGYNYSEWVDNYKYSYQNGTWVLTSRTYNNFGLPTISKTTTTSGTTYTEKYVMTIPCDYTNFQGVTTSKINTSIRINRDCFANNDECCSYSIATPQIPTRCNQDVMSNWLQAFIANGITID